MDVKVGVQHAPRELVIDSAEDPEELLATVRKALEKSALLELKDQHGRVVVVPVDRIAYVEIGENVERRVGFGAL